MLSKALRNIILLISFLAVSCFSSSKIYAAPGTGQVKSETNVYPAQQYPGGELERVHHPSAQGWNITAPKNLVPAAWPQVAIINKDLPSLKGLLVKVSSLRVKDYLLHIHPYHHFW